MRGAECLQRNAGCPPCMHHQLLNSNWHCWRAEAPRTKHPRRNWRAGRPIVVACWVSLRRLRLRSSESNLSEERHIQKIENRPPDGRNSKHKNGHGRDGETRRRNVADSSHTLTRDFVWLQSCDVAKIHSPNNVGKRGAGPGWTVIKGQSSHLSRPRTES